jgi:two-component system, NarL family, response regulator DevR
MGTIASGLTNSVASVFLLAENRLLREALLRILSKKENLRVVGAGSYSADICEQLAASHADIAVLDSVSQVLAEPGLVRELHRLNPAIRVVMVGMEADESTFLRVVQAGAVGYVLKDASAAEVARTIRAVAAGEAVCPASLSTALFRRVAQQRPNMPSLHVKNALGLSRREQQLVSLIQQGLTNKEMASRLNLSEQTVKNHMHRMLRKLGAPDRLSVVEVCRNEGLGV